MQKIYSRNMFEIKLSAICLLILFDALCSPVAADETDESYRFEFTPYLWNARIAGTLANEGGGESPPVDSGYNFVSLENLDGVASATFTVHRRRWGLLFDGLHVAYEDTLLKGTPLQVAPRLEGTILELAGTYAMTSVNHLELIAGLRQQDIMVSLALLGRRPEQSVTWIDPFAGLIYCYQFSNSFEMSLRGDLGGFGVQSEIAKNAEAMLNYRLGETFSVKFSYRYIKVKFDDSDFLYDVSLDGFKLGLGIAF